MLLIIFAFLMGNKAFWLANLTIFNAKYQRGFILKELRKIKV
tara:strand:+ start:86220 stop:86345 length:126 start_codon:yes stop_codon:yes gene_type:complete